MGVARRLCILLCALSAALVFAPAASAAQCDRVAAPGGSDSAPGSEAQPFRTAQQVADSLAAGQTGCLRAGTYAEDLTLRKGGRAGAALTLRNYPGERATVKGTFWVARSAPYVVVEGLYLNGNSGTEHPSPTVNADHVTFRDNDVQNENKVICFLLGDSDGEYGRADHAVIEDNRIHHCGILPAAGHDHGIYVEASAHSRVEGNWFYDNADYAIQLYPDADNNLIRGNVMDSNGKGITISGEAGMTSTANRIEGNVISNSKDRYNIEAWWPKGNPVPRENVVARNCLKAGQRDSFKNGGIDEEVQVAFTVEGNVVEEPSYENRATDDFRLAAASACRATFAGNPAAVPGPDNPHGAARTRSASPPVSLKVAKRSVRRGRSVRLNGRVARPHARKGRRVLIEARSGKRRKIVARLKVRSNGRFSAKPRLRLRGRVLRLRAVVRGVGRSRPVRLSVRR